MRKVTIVAVAILAVVIANITVWGQDKPSKDPDKPSIPIARMRKSGHHKLNAAICKIDVAHKTIRVAPWDGQSWRKDLVMNLSWTETTKLEASSNTITMAQFVKGKRLKGMGGDGKGSVDVEGIRGERGDFDTENVKGKLIVRKVEMIFLFGGESFPAMVGRDSAQIVGATKVTAVLDW